MRSVLTILLAAGIAAPALAAEPAQTDKTSRAQRIAEFQARCAYRPEQAVNKDTPKRPMRLTEAPPARMELAVDRRIYGCPVPVIVRGVVPK